MSLPEIKFCPGTLKEGYNSYSNLALKRVFSGRKVNHILTYESPASNIEAKELFTENRKRMSISGVQEKFSVLLEKNKIRLIKEGEHGEYILKPIPNVGKNTDQMPANEHLTMQIARQVFGIETAENALMFFKNGDPAYITKRFDVKENGDKRAQEDFATLAGRAPQTHGEDFKYLGSYLELFELLKKYSPAYQIESIKLFRLVLFNYLISNGDAHFKNFSLIETPLGDFRLSPAYDLLNSRIHIEDKDFALDDGLLPPRETKGKIKEQFFILGELAGIPENQIKKTIKNITTHEDKVLSLINASYLNEKTKRNYIQAYQTRLKKLLRD
ncbi:MAG: HipA domain-containing protein [Flavobacteriales bacterium]|nr:HipA domain-containing protein [Flavobacteriales bacterium]PIV94089.1 MAG: phosphatidylinositol kinase [Flavobacteriaceae bacterium CG17_big_fil_post_rev_8_21_14_2_50_33_15]PIY13479.1 MAG: phosphatidylinositol kinase [Flavobacteriaceae bacterium CG_4_10_14_3_um_filter_33_47]PJB17263.1 MAG: phosphatidylinositol kinase [Flavobacteriaceae bacterium CG_4_9_14_3_um_filter_33_16]NCP59260.1 HipA domain-containing protein [Flavobacteriales bacterium]